MPVLASACRVSSAGSAPLILCGHRYYDPENGRWLTRDPIGYAGGINLYAFCWNNPTNVVDPLGTSGFWSLYMEDKLGIGRFADKTLMGGATKEFGASVGLYETGCGNIGQVLWAGTRFTGLLVLNGVSIFSGAKALSEVPCMLLETGCFVAGTSVVMADGSTKPIETIKPGDIVLSRDQSDSSSGKVLAKKVLTTSVREVSSTLTVTLSNGEHFECTPEHPIYVDGKGFVEAKDLGIGTSIVTRAGPAIQVSAIERHNKPTTVYNFTVEDTHTYFVGTTHGGVWVHNGLCGTELHHIFPQERRLAQIFSDAGIDIDEFAMKLDRSVHVGLHKGAGGGQWNQAWHEFFQANPGASSEDIYRHAGKLIYDFNIDGSSIVRYR